MSGYVLFGKRGLQSCVAFVLCIVSSIAWGLGRAQSLGYTSMSESAQPRDDLDKAVPQCV